jgi:hypothetical protein
MPWVFAGIDDEQLTAGEWEHIYLLVNMAGLPHPEAMIEPAHCPTCRNVIAAVILGREDGVTAEVIQAVTSMPVGDLIDAFVPGE